MHSLVYETGDHGRSNKELSRIQMSGTCSSNAPTWALFDDNLTTALIGAVAKLTCELAGVIVPKVAQCNEVITL